MKLQEATDLLNETQAKHVAEDLAFIFKLSRGNVQKLRTEIERFWKDLSPRDKEGITNFLFLLGDNMNPDSTSGPLQTDPKTGKTIGPKF